jgi:hypothetical protein
MNEFDFLIKFYCEILYRWSLFNKRIEMLEFVYEKPTEMDEKFGNYFALFIFWLIQSCMIAFEQNADNFETSL